MCGGVGGTGFPLYEPNSIDSETSKPLFEKCNPLRAIPVKKSGGGGGKSP